MRSARSSSLTVPRAADVGVLGFRNVGENRAAAARDEKVDVHRIERGCETEQHPEVLYAGPRLPSARTNGRARPGPGRQSGPGSDPKGARVRAHLAVRRCRAPRPGGERRSALSASRDTVAIRADREANIGSRER